jgi:hypothetical protein
MTDEKRRREEARDPNTSWRKWGPYLSERQWGTVREDYSDPGNAGDRSGATSTPRRTSSAPRRASSRTTTSHAQPRYSRRPAGCGRRTI